jgi:hypothetical protein
MPEFVQTLFLGGYGFVLLPASLLILATYFDSPQTPERPSRVRLFVLVSITALALALMDLLIWFNPYGREINSSLAGVGMLIVWVALASHVLHHAGDLARSWPSDRIPLIVFTLIFLGLLGFLWLGDTSAFLAAVLLPVVLRLALYVPRAGPVFMGALSLLTLGVLIAESGGWLFIPSADAPAGLRTVRSIALVTATLLSILLPAGLLYSLFRVPSALDRSAMMWGLILIAILLAGVAYQNYWEGIWSSAHARAFEDHLPFAHFMISLIAGVALALMLSRSSPWVGPLYTVGVTTIAALAFTAGWHVSAFDMTERRAASVNSAILAYQRQHGYYPKNLAELSPRYLPILPPPVVVHQGGWCYEGGSDYYRLGYISGDFTYFEADFKVETYAQAGNLPGGSWACDDLRAGFQAMELVY